MLIAFGHIINLSGSKEVAELLLTLGCIRQR